MELVILLFIAIFVMSYRQQNGENVYKFITDTVKTVYNKYAPYSYQEVREKSKALGQEYTPKEYLMQVLLLGGGAAGIAYLYFYSITWAIFYCVAAIMFIPYLAYLRNNRVYSEFLFEEIQVYTTNVINEFNTTQSFVKALEGVRDSGILEDPVLSDVKTMIDMSYANGTIDESIEWFDKKYPYYMVKNMHQLFAQITKEGAKDSGESLENMMLDIDVLVEGVYRDKMDREVSHKKFVTFGFALYLLVMLTQALLNEQNYKTMLKLWYVQVLLHMIIIVNSYFLITGEKFYNQDTGLNSMYYEILALAVIVVFVMQYVGGFSINKFVDDNANYFKKLQEDDFEFYAKAKYGEAIDIDKLFNNRLRDALLVGLAIGFLFINSMSYVTFIVILVLIFGMFKLPYMQLKQYYKSHLHLIDTQLPYYLKNLEILIQHYTVPVALGKSVGDAPEIFQEGLRDLIEKINAGDYSINPYMEFAKEYPVRDSMRMMRLLYRLGLGKQEHKQEQLLTFSKTVSNLQQKAREARYKERLDKMESKTMQMLVCTGIGVMLLLVLSILQTFS